MSMPTSRSRRAGRSIGGFVIASLLVVSLLASGHHHSSDQKQAPESCPLCMVKTNSPALTAPPVPLLAPLPHLALLVLRPTAKLAVIYRSFKAGRAPPAHAPIHAA